MMSHCKSQGSNGFLEVKVLSFLGFQETMFLGHHRKLCSQCDNCSFSSHRSALTQLTERSKLPPSSLFNVVIPCLCAYGQAFPNCDCTVSIVCTDVQYYAYRLSKRCSARYSESQINVVLKMTNSSVGKPLSVMSGIQGTHTGLCMVKTSWQFLHCSSGLGCSRLVSSAITYRVSICSMFPRSISREQVVLEVRFLLHAIQLQSDALRHASNTVV